MRCDRCEQEAVVHELIRKDGVLIEKHLCVEHAREEGLEGTPTPLHEVLTKLVGAVPGAAARVRVQSPSCPRCGLTFAEFRQTGLLGCPGCYEAFEDRLGPLLERAHEGATHHVGKVPRRHRSGQAAGGVEGGDPLLAERRALLRRQLDDAIAGEQYERAAAIRDELRRLGDDVDQAGSSPAGPAAPPPRESD